jgi:Raf kinase inhibitor-like YbhB/YbcL family protein
MEDPDAPSGTFTHWVLYNIPGERRAIPSGISSVKELPGGEVQGITSRKTTGYTPPCPPGGTTHRYVFTIFTLDTRLDIDTTMDADMLRKTMEGHILGTGQLVGTYGRS